MLNLTGDQETPPATTGGVGEPEGMIVALAAKRCSMPLFMIIFGNRLEA